MFEGKVVNTPILHWNQIELFIFHAMKNAGQEYQLVFAC